ncbi:hypothetical protein HSRCO_3030 (plasmid) [Halanaeroarchaeum sp. HSR-CO]|uniref:hypothetical protein n=1 Tax=Halanaeroarchaeum sp. HSR-CO TaxID=2866382 RepID=UPI00217CD615|nr:hypothetical protein [Halanaeroarchaeum sp. HSR-CO]UWG49171.1 hypothetical protein HSRCO_3030 [Halanaeroarchaeum sp. HSR-CO]
MSIQDHISLDREESRIEEEILNVIRRSDAGFVGTTEISDSPTVDRGEDSVRETYLPRLEDKNRVSKKRIGDPENGNLAWYLPEGERKRPVNPDIYWAARISEGGRDIGTTVLRIGGLLALTGFMLLMMSLTADIAHLDLAILTPSTAGYLGYILAGMGFANLFVGGVLKWGLTVLEQIIERRA